MSVTPALIKEVREKTGLGLMKCKTALVESAGDVTKAIENLRKQGLASAEKRSGRSTNQGLVFPCVSENGKKGAILSLCCETDFVAKTDDFKALGEKLSKFVSENKIDSAEALNSASIDGETGGDLIKGVIAKMGENMQVGAVHTFETSGSLFHYIHGEGGIGVMIDLEGTETSDSDLGRDICLHITAMSPDYVSRNDVEASVLEKEKEILAEQVKGKPDNIVEKIVAGRLNKFYSENCLLEQSFVKDDSLSIEQFLKKCKPGAKINRFERIDLGS